MSNTLKQFENQFSRTAHSLVKDMEEDVSETFYTCLKTGIIDLSRISKDFLAWSLYIMALFTFYTLKESNSKYFRRHVEGKDYVLNDGIKLEDYEEGFQLFFTSLRSLFPKETLDTLAKLSEEKRKEI